MSDAFGTALKEWRGRRRMSQLDLGLEAGVSSRHISFLETGRSRPSRGMVLRLCDELQVPVAERNRLLTAAGMAPAYGARALSDAEMEPVRAAVAWMLERHAPYPAMALNRHWELTSLNRPAEMLLMQMGLVQGASLVEALAGDEALRAAIENLAEVEAHIMARLRLEIDHLGGDAVLEAALAQLMERGPAAAAPEGALPPFVPTIYRMGDMRLSFLSTVSQFGTAEDVMLSELKVELLFPADEATRATLEAMARGQEESGSAGPRTP